MWCPTVLGAMRQIMTVETRISSAKNLQCLWPPPALQHQRMSTLMSPPSSTYPQPSHPSTLSFLVLLHSQFRIMSAPLSRPVIHMSLKRPSSNVAPTHPSTQPNILFLVLSHLKFRIHPAGQRISLSLSSLSLSLSRYLIRSMIVRDSERMLSS